MAGLSLLLLVGVGAVTWLIANPEAAQPYRATAPTSPPRTVEPGAASLALRDLENAVERGDRAAATALAPPGDAAAADLLGALVDNASAAHLVEVTFRYLDELGGADAGGNWSAAVGVTWRYDGFDRAAARSEVLVRFRSDAGDDSDSDGAVAIVGIGGGDTLRTPVWLSGPLQVRRTPEVLVLLAGGGDPQALSDLASYTQLATDAVPVVGRVLTDWTPRLVIEAPADGAALERALGVDPGYYGQIAAVTGTGDGSTAPGSPIHVFVNRDVFDGLGRAGQEVVLAHEATHVATEAPRSVGPTWLVEGFADYVALRDTSLPLTKTAAQIARQVEQQGSPTGLPVPADFDTRGPHLGAVYESAWLLCVTLADRGGEDTLRQFYGAVSQGASIDDELVDRFGWTVNDLLDAWQTRLSGLVG